MKGKLPIAKNPADVKCKLRDESIYSGEAEFYRLRYGNYLIGMNRTTNKTFQLKIPSGAKKARELVSEQSVTADSPMRIASRSTVLWFKNGEK